MSRRYYPKEVLYWQGVGKENRRLLNKIFRIDRVSNSYNGSYSELKYLDVFQGRRKEKKAVTMTARSRSSSAGCCRVEESSTYCAQVSRGSLTQY